MDTSSMSVQEMREYIEMLEEEVQTLTKERQNDKDTYSALEDEYEAQIKKLEADYANMYGKMLSLNITLESYKDKVGTPVIIEGQEQDLYEGEQKDFLIGLLRQAMGSYDKFTRSYKICESLLAANFETGKRADLKDRIYALLRSYSGMSGNLISSLNDIGIQVVMDDKTHYKLLLAGDERYYISISHTPSDVRCGLNAISDINRLFF